MGDIQLDRDKLRQLRMDRKWSYADAAEAAGFRFKQQWFALENGGGRVTLKTINKIAKAVGLDDPRALLRIAAKPTRPQKRKSPR